MTEYSFVQLKKAAKQPVPETADTLFVMGDCATQHLTTALKGTAALCGLPLRVMEAEYNLIDAMVIDEHSELYECKPKYVLIYQCTEKLLAAFDECKDKSTFAEVTAQKIIRNWHTILGRTQASILQFTFVEEDDSVFGSYALKTADSFLYQVKKLNMLLIDAGRELSGVFLPDLNGLCSAFGLSRLRDDKLYYVAKMPLSLEALPEAAWRVIGLVKAIRGVIRKCVICDLDNTLWGGVIGDDGLSGIQVGELGLGHAFTDLQCWLKRLKERGIILCVCSKNNEDTAKEPFEKHPEMTLRLDDISVFVANWEDKASNIRAIQKVLNIGFDSMVFLDDNPFERGLVRTALPDVTVPELPEDPSLYLAYLKSLNLFETAAYSAGDKDRTRQYKAEADRVKLEASFESYDDYLRSLDMKAVAAPFDAYQRPRISQLTQRSNQFNLRTVRCTEADIEAYAASPDYITRYFMLEDKFGDHGLISLAMLKKQDDETLFIENWLMSCRVLRRGMEAFIIADLARTAKEAGFARIIGEYIPTPKNAMVKEIYPQYGFTPMGDNRFVLDLAAFEPIPHFISYKEV